MSEEEQEDTKLASQGLSDSLVNKFIEHDENQEQPLDETVPQDEKITQEEADPEEGQPAETEGQEVVDADSDLTGDLLAGKFQTISALETGYDNVQLFGRKVAQENSDLRTNESELVKRVAELEDKLSQPQVSPESNMMDDSWFDDAYEEDPRAAMKKYIASQTEQSRRAALHEINQNQALVKMQDEIVASNPRFADPQSQEIKYLQDLILTASQNPKDPKVIAAFAHASSYMANRNQDVEIAEKLGMAKGARQQKQKRMSKTVSSTSKLSKSTQKLSGDAAELYKHLSREIPDLKLAERSGD